MIRNRSAAMRHLLTMIFAAALAAPGALAGEKGLHVSAGVMTMMNALKQGGQGPEGLTLLTQSEVNYHFDWTGIGGFIQFDKQGASQTDIAFGPKIEFHKSVFYVEAGYALHAQRTYTDRSIAKESGNGWLFGIGTRFMLGGGPAGGGGSSKGGLFLQFSYKYRIINIRRQDGTILSEPITQKDGYPLFGLGYLF